MSGRVLVAYASKSGTTEEVARAIADELTAIGDTVDLRSMERGADPDGYDAVVVGSGVRFGKWLPSAAKYVEEHKAQLVNVPTAFFTVHGLATDDSAASRQKREGYLAPIRLMIEPDREAFFAGRIDYSRLGAVERLIAKAVKAGEQDLRDWPAIQAWADEVHADLAARTA